MKVVIKLFAGLREAIGVAQLEVELKEGKTLAELKQELIAQGEQWQPLAAAQILVAVNQTMANLETELADGDEVAFFPPVTGG